MTKKVYLLFVAIAAVLSIMLDHRGLFGYYKFAKPLTTILILAFPIVFWNKRNTKYNYLIISALIFCLIGDIFLLWEDGFLLGLAFFLIAHLIFSTAFVSLHGFDKNFWLLILLLFIGGAYLFFLRPHLSDFFLPVLIYVSVILFMNWQAIALSISKHSKIYKWIGWAAAIFAFSDATIAYNKFVDPFSFSGILVLSSYWLAISIFAYSTQLVGTAE